MSDDIEAMCRALGMTQGSQGEYRAGEFANRGILLAMWYDEADRANPGWAYRLGYRYGARAGHEESGPVEDAEDAAGRYEQAHRAWHTQDAEGAK